VPVRALVRACGQADIVVSDRALPRNCRPRWLKADRRLLARTGGIAIDLAAGVIVTVERTGDEHPWRLKRR
jgi:competence protein ComEC